MGLSHETLSAVADYLQGSCKSIGEAVDAFDLDVDEGALQAKLLEVDVEICMHCYWWHELCELEHSDDHGGGLCEDCREELGVDEA